MDFQRMRMPLPHKTAEKVHEKNWKETKYNKTKLTKKEQKLTKKLEKYKKYKNKKDNPDTSFIGQIRTLFSQTKNKLLRRKTNSIDKKIIKTQEQLDKIKNEKITKENLIKDLELQSSSITRARSAESKQVRRSVKEEYAAKKEEKQPLLPS